MNRLLKHSAWHGCTLGIIAVLGFTIGPLPLLFERHLNALRWLAGEHTYEDLLVLDWPGSFLWHGLLARTTQVTGADLVGLLIFTIASVTIWGDRHLHHVGAPRFLRGGLLGIVALGASTFSPGGFASQEHLFSLCLYVLAVGRIYSSNLSQRGWWAALAFFASVHALYLVSLIPIFLCLRRPGDRRTLPLLLAISAVSMLPLIWPLSPHLPVAWSRLWFATTNMVRLPASDVIWRYAFLFLAVLCGNVYLKTKGEQRQMPVVLLAVIAISLGLITKDYLSFDWLPQMVVLMIITSMIMLRKNVLTKVGLTLLAVFAAVYLCVLAKQKTNDLLATHQPLDEIIQPTDRVLLVSTLSTEFCLRDMVSCVGPPAHWFHLHKLGDQRMSKDLRQLGRNLTAVLQGAVQGFRPTLVILDDRENIGFTYTANDILNFVNHGNRNNLDYISGVPGWAVWRVKAPSENPSTSH